MEIKVYGAGCASCKKLHSLALDAVKELNLNTEVLYITDMNEIVQAGIMRTPALFVNGKAKAIGRVPSVKELKQIISDEM